MSLHITSLNSGSNGNCYYVGTATEAVLVDVGLSCREVEKRMRRCGLDILSIRAIFISHEHTDHIRGLHSILKKYSVPVYCTALTARACLLRAGYVSVRHIAANDEVMVGALKVSAFSKNHDAADPVSFVISCAGLNVGVFTDIGTPCVNLISHFGRCHAAFLEANYDEQMLEKGNYPYHLKRRIRGGSGHLSNREALDIFTLHRAPFLSYLILSHLSKNNNCPRLVAELFAAHANGANIVVASRDAEIEVCHITLTKPASRQQTMKVKASQLSLAFA